MRRFSAGRWEDCVISPPEEVSLNFVVNGVELVTVQCSPEGFEDLGSGFLFTNGVIDGMDDIESMRFSLEDCTLFYTLTKDEVPVPRRFVITTGFGGGPVFSEEPSVCRIESGFAVSPGPIELLAAEMKDRAVQYRRSGGIHATALCSCGEVVFLAEDVGRQNSMDKVIGHCLCSGISFVDKVMLTTGRISFEMVAKAMRAGIPALVSLSSPTVKAVWLAERCGIGIAGYVGGGGFVAYSHEHRFGG